MAKSSLNKAVSSNVKLQSGTIDEDNYSIFLEIVNDCFHELPENLLFHLKNGYAESDAMSYQIPEDIDFALDEFIEQVIEIKGLPKGLLDYIDLDRLKDDIMIDAYFSLI
jgi:hypothetical protein